jgi:hypothetical protein
LNIPETWNIHKEVGFKYDSSYGHTYNLGFKEGKVRPFFPIDTNFMVIPVIIMDTFLFNGQNSMKKVWQLCKKILDFSERNNCLITLLWHQRVFNNKEFPYYSEIYERIISEGKERGAFVGNCNQIYDYYNALH